jgi:SAM-dependent methyltransferase
MATTTLTDWFQDAASGNTCSRRSARTSDDVTPDIFGFHALQLGLPEVDLLRESASRTSCARPRAARPTSTRAATSCRFATQSIDLVLLPHVLEFAEEPHAILREVDRVMMPEGRLVILGFNPWSLWGLRSALGFSRNEHPWNGRFLSLLRVKDWLALLGFEVAGPPHRLRAALRQRRVAPPLRFMEPAGDRWWAVGGAVYMLQAIKRVRGMRLITPRWQEKDAREKALVAAAKREGHDAPRPRHLRIVK